MTWQNPILWLLALTASGTLAAPMSSTAESFRAGAATSNITPWLGVSISGSMRDITATHIHDELHARCLVLDDGTSRLAFAIVDSCMVPRSAVDAAKEMAEARTGIPTAHILVSATHTHSAACATPIFQSDPDPAYVAFLSGRIADGITRAYNQREAARIGWGSAQLPEEVFNRRWHITDALTPPNPFGTGSDRVWMNPPRGSEHLVEPAGPVDPEIAFLSATATDGRPLSLLANYGLHYVGGTGAGHVSADYFAVFADALGHRIDTHGQRPPFVAMMSNGASGDVNNIDFRAPAESRPAYVQMTRVGERAADRVHGAWAEVVHHDWASLSGIVEEITLGVRKPSAEEVAAAEARLAAHGDAPLTALEDIYARETVLLAEYPDEQSVPLQVLRIGALAVVGIPCEVFAEIGLAIKQESPFAQTFVISLANGYYGYLPTARHHELGGYETWRARSSYLETGAAERITATVRRMLDELDAR